MAAAYAISALITMDGPKRHSLTNDNVPQEGVVANGRPALVFERAQDKICRIGAPLDNGNGRPSGER